MKFKKEMKKCFAVVLSLAMVATSTAVYDVTTKADAASRAATIEQIQNETVNLALGKAVKVLPNMQAGEGGANGDGVKLITDGNVDSNHIATAFNTKDTSYVVDLGKAYDASGIDQIVTQYKEKNAGDTPVKGYKIQYSQNGIDFYDVKEVAAQADENNPTWAEEGQGNLDVQDVSCEAGKVVQYVKISYPDSYTWGIQVKEIAILDTDGNAQEVEVEKCADAAAVTVKSEDFNTITYNITAGENQEDYVYMVYLDGANEIGTRVAAGVDHTVTGVVGGIHTVTVIAVYDGKTSAGITSEEVEVLDVSTLITGTRNITNVNNNADAKVIYVSELYDENFTLDTAQVVLDGLIPTGEGNNVALRTKGTPVDVIIDLGAEYTPKQFEQVILAYSNPRTYAATTSVSFSIDNENYTEVGGSTGYVCQKDGGGVADLNMVPLDAEKMAAYDENAVRYIKLTLSEGQSGWGYVVNEIAVIINGNVDEAEIFTGKDPVEAPTIASKVYTGETLVADVSETADYEVTTNEGGVDAGTYDVVLTLKDPDHFRWSDDRRGRAVTKTLSFEITQDTNEWTSDLAIDSWKYGEEAKEPTITAKYGEPIYTYSTEEDGEYTSTVPENAGTYYVKAEVAETANYAGLEGVVTTFEIGKADQNAPEGIETLASTLEENADGMITNVTDAMEYRAEDETEYTPIEGTEIADVLAGKYYVRYQETDNYNASADTEVVVETGRKLAVELISGEGYEVKAVDTEETEVAYGTEYAFQVVLAEGYKKDSKVVVKVNGEEVKADAEGVYKVEVTEDIEVTVEGVVKDIPETTAPVVTDPVTTPGGVTPTKPQTTTPKKVLKKTSVTVASKKKAAKKVKITFKKVKGAKKYNVQISTTKKFKKVLVKKTVKKVKVTITSKKLANKKKLYVRVKAVGAKQWSKAKKIKIKK